RLRPAVAGALSGLTFSTLQQRGVLLGVWLAVALLLVPGPGPRPTTARSIRALGWAAAGWVAAVLTALGPAAWHSSLAELVEGTFRHVVSAYAGAFVG